MGRMRLWSLAVAGLIFALTPTAHAQLRLTAQNFVLGDITITPANPAVLATNVDSPEIFALDVPATPSSSYVQFTCSAVWTVEFAGLTEPERANFQLRFDVTSPAFPPGIVLHYAVPLTNYLNNVTTAGGIQGGTGVDSEALTRNFLAQFLAAENASLTALTAGQIADDMFRQGFHVSVFARLAKARNVTDAIVTNPNVAFFAQPGSLK